MGGGICDVVTFGIMARENKRKLTTWSAQGAIEKYLVLTSSRLCGGTYGKSLNLIRVANAVQIWTCDTMTENLCDNFMVQCRHCVYFRVGADLKNVKSICKRIDHKHIQFAMPYFHCYDAGQFNECICRDFEPSPTWKYLYEHWKGFDDYYQSFDDYDRSIIWGRPIAFVVDGNKAVRYYIKSTDFINGTMFNKDGYLRWIYKQYYVATRSDPYGYKLVIEYPDELLVKENCRNGMEAKHEIPR